jgi:hypothetical protein
MCGYVNVQLTLAFRGADIGDIDEIADRIRLGHLLGGFVAGYTGRPADAMKLEAAIECRARQVRDGDLQRI